ncbi:hypothetical protein [Georgenia faecalis]|uniref:hypothetical protein n=1 Tax=Georgenia faecalis TaxID=2483799 RepID=UPI000FDA25E6|nr:hypothetical protein [Georgenia faecalis]
MSEYAESTPITEPETDLEEVAPEETPDAEEYTPPDEVRADLDGSEADILEQAIDVPQDEDEDEPPA